ncbi:hypothetical protein GCM10009827_117440 [Dactylosporangium maewongense]|uniref:Uncharacterized protein n=1 Tax=Dactylosporangium maewongense TaxID=634393 RepID=A0ABP4PC92_9ACTN
MPPQGSRPARRIRTVDRYSGSRSSSPPTVARAPPTGPRRRSTTGSSRTSARNAIATSRSRSLLLLELRLPLQFLAAHALLAPDLRLAFEVLFQALALQVELILEPGAFELQGLLHLGELVVVALLRGVADVLRVEDLGLPVAKYGSPGS